MQPPVGDGAVTNAKIVAGSNLYMHYVHVLSPDAVNAFFSFPSAQASKYTSLSTLFPALRNLFGIALFSCNGLFRISNGAFGTIQYGYMSPQQANLLYLCGTDLKGSQVENELTTGSAMQVTDTVVPIISN